jgi:hypothetical protein
VPAQLLLTTSTSRVGRFAAACADGNRLAAATVAATAASSGARMVDLLAVRFIVVEGT